ncbi:ribonuclease HII [Croceivirga radicis]|uniref:ribonuclease HII n=1 Tax=Croceivirga radicis TaxID=1929488 RepID=UPI000255AEA6|nr:ribonuclease HII [Croceivirga radicis]
MINSFYKSFNEAGTDEAGRGCLAGPVTAAAIILPKSFENEILNDSKQLTKIQRNSLRTILEEKCTEYGVVHISEKEIDQINILNASILGMHRALDQLKQIPEHILVDGNKFKPYKQIPHTCFVKGDSRFLSIAAASVLAKTYRDDYMLKIHEEFPVYNWAKNKGYPTREHRAAILKHGPCKYHRKTFKLLPEQLSFDL